MRKKVSSNLSSEYGYVSLFLLFLIFFVVIVHFAMTDREKLASIYKHLTSQASTNEIGSARITNYEKGVINEKELLIHIMQNEVEPLYKNFQFKYVNSLLIDDAVEIKIMLQDIVCINDNSNEGCGLFEKIIFDIQAKTKLKLKKHFISMSFFLNDLDILDQIIKSDQNASEVQNLYTQSSIISKFVINHLDSTITTEDVFSKQYIKIKLSLKFIK
jgi:hypothetical protein